jgi:hypothetical protein
MTEKNNLSSAPRGSVILYNPISGRGHFDSWCSIFTSTLVRLGWTVHIITPDRTPLLKLLTDIGVDSEKYRIYDRSTRFYRNLSLDLIVAPRSEGDENRRIDNLKLVATDGQGRVLGYFGTVAHKGIAKLKRLFASVWEPIEAFWQPRLSISHLDPIIFSQDIAILSKGLSASPALVLNMYIDQYEAALGPWSVFLERSKFNWACIHFDTSRTFLKAEFEASPYFKGALYINEDVRPPVNARYRWIPDITITKTLPNISAELAFIKNQAGSRTIVFLGGAISGDKNLSVWYETLLLSDPSRWFFIQIGQMDHSTLSTLDMHYLRKIEQLNPEHLFVLDRYIADERAFNSYIQVSDIVWCLYRSFKRSSNLLTKAAFFKKPALVSAGNLLGERALKFGIGISADEGSAQAAIKALAFIDASTFNEESFLAYTRAFGLEAFEFAIDRHLTEFTESRAADTARFI